MTQGKLFIFLLFGVALILAGFGLYFRYTQTHEVVAFWGPEGSRRIASPDQVELWQLKPWSDQSGNSPTAARISIQDRQYVSTETRNVTKARGFINASSALTLNRNYNWNPRDDEPVCEPTWTHALLYRRGEHTTVVAVSMDCGWVYSAETDRVASIKSITEGLARLFQEQLGS
jgi:hypothetical protein